MRRLIVPVLFGAVGIGILVSLGVWQERRLVWKENILAEIDRRIAQAPVSLPAAPNPVRDKYLSVRLTGVSGQREIHVLTSRALAGPGYRVISTFTTGTRTILLDQGFVRQSDVNTKRSGIEGEIIGNLLWPDEVDAKFTPKPDLKSNIWFARDVPAMAKALGAEPILVVLRQGGQNGVAPWPVDSSGIPNNHLQYAITWFLMAAGWFGMTVYWVWRIRRKRD